MMDLLELFNYIIYICKFELLLERLLLSSNNITIVQQ